MQVFLYVSPERFELSMLTALGVDCTLTYDTYATLRYTAPALPLLLLLLGAGSSKPQ